MKSARIMEKQKAISPGLAGGTILFFFFLSGALGLVYEVLWTRLLRLVMGNTVYSVTTVLCAFMGGLALGSFWGGRFIDRRRDPLRVFALLEGMIGLYCLLLPALIGTGEPLYRLIYRQFHPNFYLFSLVRFLYSALVLLIPATLMGATLPVLSKYFVRSSGRIGGTVGRLYAVNTLGAVLGCFSAGFLCIPLWGVSRTLYSAAVLNLFIGLGIYVIHVCGPGGSGEQGRILSRETGNETDGQDEEKPVRSRLFPPVLLFGYGISGFAALIYEISWTRVLSLIIGSSVYAFSLMLTAFILGLGLGSLIFSQFIDRRKDLIVFLALIEFLIGFSVLIVVPLVDRLPLFMMKAVLDFAHSFWALQVVEFGLIFFLLLIPTTMMGAAFPLVTRLYTRRVAEIGRSVGNIYTANTLGSILGAFVGGFVFIPWLGLQRTIAVAVLVNVLLGAVFLGFSPVFSRPKKRAIAVGLVLAAVVLGNFLPAWNKILMSSGTYLYARELARSAAEMNSTLTKEMAKKKVLYHKEGVSATIAVVEDSQKRRFFVINGKTDASSSDDMPTQELLAHAPLLLHPDPRSVLVIGLATGVTLGSAGLYPLERLDCVEISPEAVEACHFFDQINYNVLSDPRVEVTIGDGRNYLALCECSYDVITSEPSNPWVAGVADLFTREFFQLCRRRLNRGGIVCIWLHAYNLEDETFRSIVYTFQEVFPQVIIWESMLAGDYLLIGSAEELAVDYGSLRRRISGEKISRDLERIKIDCAEKFLGHFVMGEGGVKDYVRGYRLHTDDNALVEFSAPRSLYRIDTEIQVLDGINRYRGTGLVSFLRWKGETVELAGVNARVGQLIKAKGHVTRGHIHLIGGREELALRELKQAVDLSPEDATAGIGRYLKVLSSRAGDYLDQGLTEKAIEIYRGLSEINPANMEVRSKLSIALLRKGRYDEVIAECRSGLEINSDQVILHNNLAVAYLGKGMYDEAVAECEAALTVEPDSVEAHNNLGIAFSKKGMYKEAIVEFQAALAINPGFADAYYNLGIVYETLGDYRRTKECLEKALEFNPKLREAREYLRRLEMRDY